MAAAGINWALGQTFTEDLPTQLEAVKLCLEKGADVNAANSMGLTAVFGAANRGADDILAFLVDHGARLDVKDKQGRTPMAWAEGVFLATNAPERKPSTIALIEKLNEERCCLSSAGGERPDEHVSSDRCCGVGIQRVPSGCRPNAGMHPISSFVTKYCQVCHNDRLKTGGLSLQQMDPSQVSRSPETWEKVVRKLRAGMMPPAACLARSGPASTHS